MYGGTYLSYVAVGLSVHETLLPSPDMLFTDKPTPYKSVDSDCKLIIINRYPITLEFPASWYRT